MSRTSLCNLSPNQLQGPRPARDIERGQDERRAVEGGAGGGERREAGKWREKAVAEKDGGTKCIHFEREGAVRSTRGREESPQFYLIYPQRLKGPILSYFTPSARPPFQTPTLSNRDF